MHFFKNVTSIIKKDMLFSYHLIKLKISFIILDQICIYYGCFKLGFKIFVAITKNTLYGSKLSTFL